MVLNADGFYRPNVDRQQCDECGACQRRCPVLVDSLQGLSISNWMEPKAFAAWTKNDSVRLSSSSGGVFNELTERVLAEGGAVAGCVWGTGWAPEHVLTNSVDVIKRMRGSKYVPSKAGRVYRDVLNRLQNESGPVLFSGTPCQVAAMATALSDDQRKRVLMVEVLCHGLPSLHVFHHYLQELFEGDKIESYSFRDKFFGWQSVHATSSSGRIHHMPAIEDSFMLGFIHHLYLMEACYHCQFARLPRFADLTLGDFWGCPERWFDIRGVSVILANSSKGMAAIEAAQSHGSLIVEAVSFQEAVAKNKRAVQGKYPVPKKRRAFLDGMIEGKSFAKLQATLFPSRSEVLWCTFLGSDHKLPFLGNIFIAMLRKILRLFSSIYHRCQTTTVA
jgi:coenzyme F420-reducing hydrogenase beta subunit